MTSTTRMCSSLFVIFSLTLIFRLVDARSSEDVFGTEDIGGTKEINGNPLTDEENLKIIGGYDAEKGKFPWQVSIRSGDFHFCGGSIIDEHWILTAAHCLDESEASDITVVAGEYDMKVDEGTEVSVGAARLFIHEEYDETGNKENDIGLIHLDGSLDLNSIINAIELPDDEQSFQGEVCTVSGWGTLNENIEESYHILQEVDVPVVSDKTCEGGCRRYSCKIETTQLCAGYKEGGKDACQGDSGGPLACHIDSTPRLAGIVSVGYGCAEPRLYGIYTEVSYYIDWIKTAMENSAFSVIHANHSTLLLCLSSIVLVINYLKNDIF